MDSGGHRIRIRFLGAAESVGAAGEFCVAVVEA